MIGVSKVSQARAIGSLLLLVFVFASARAADAPARKIPTIGIAVPIKTRTITATQKTKAKETIWQDDKVVFQTGALFVRLHIATAMWTGSVAPTLEVLDMQGAALRTYSLSDFPSDGFWLDPIKGTTLRLRLVAQPSNTPATATISLDRYIRGVLGGRLESVRDPNAPTFEPISALAPGSTLATAAKAVAKILFAGVQADSVCTGFLVGADLLLTNEHCVPAGVASASCRALKVAFDWDPSQGMAPTGAYNCSRVAKVDPGLDYALVRLDKPAGQKWGILKFAAASPAAHAQMAVIQYPYPSGGQKIARKNCSIVTVGVDGSTAGGKADFSHTCDTDGGSSGSPVLGINDGLVYGLHHWGFDLVGDYQALNRAVLANEIQLQSAVPAQ